MFKAMKFKVKEGRNYAGIPAGRELPGAWDDKYNRGMLIDPITYCNYFLYPADIDATGSLDMIGEEETPGPKTALPSIASLVGHDKFTLTAG